jgi:hypothetical protein
MIFRIRDLLPSPNASTQIGTGQWVCAMHEPFYDGLIERFRNAWAVIKGDAVTVYWPKNGEFEQAMAIRERGN